MCARPGHVYASLANRDCDCSDDDRANQDDDDNVKMFISVACRLLCFFHRCLQHLRCFAVFWVENDLWLATTSHNSAFFLFLEQFSPRFLPVQRRKSFHFYRRVGRTIVVCTQHSCLHGSLHSNVRLFLLVFGCSGYETQFWQYARDFTVTPKTRWVCSHSFQIRPFSHDVVHVWKKINRTTARSSETRRE